MHPYATDSPRRGQVLLALVVISIPLTIVLNELLKAARIDVPWYLESPSLLAVYSVLWFFFDRWLWRKINRWFPDLLQVPDLNGGWKGSVRSSYDEFSQDYPVTISVKQSWSAISIRLKADLSNSQSFTASILTQTAGACILHYTYLNEPRARAVDTQVMHRGTATLELVSEGRLEGQYYNSRGRKTHGDICVERV